MEFVADSIDTLTRLGAYVLAVDDRGVMRWVSKRVEAFFGEDVTGTRLDQFTVESNRPLVCLALRRNDGVVVPLRGDWISWGDDADRVFVGSPAPETTAEMASIGLTLDDYRENDSWLNYLIRSDEAATTQADANERIKELKRRHAEAARIRDQMRDARKAALNMMYDVEHSRERAEKARAELAATQEKLMAASRHAGMAEIATGVLHNVGNVLNSINVSAVLVVDKILKSKVGGLAKATELMREHARDLGAFITEDEKGRNLPGYLTKLSEHLRQEQEAVVRELASLAENVEHVKQIIAAQQSYAGRSGVVAPVSLSDVLKDAVTVNLASFDRHTVHVVREYEEVPHVTTDKHKLLQIMINLLSNAKDAMIGNEPGNKQLTLRIRRNGEARVGIEIMDTGMGIPEENLTRIFSHGFTTKEDGHGFGLHSAALAAKEMGGSLSAHSDGPGKGATFTLELPLEVAEVTV